MTVIDASVVVTALVHGEYADWAEKHLSTAGSGRSLYAPHLLDVEVGHALRRRVAARKLRDDRASAALSELAVLPLRRVVHTGLLDRAWQLRHNVSFYDGIYVALAELLGAPLITLDRRLAKAVGDAASVTVLTVG
ncbi:MAG: type II toxin-antitoxin system VapC family toxin [Chloroflexota bacterium]